MANIGSLTADLAMRTAAFQRNMTKTTQLLASETAKMRRSLRNVEQAGRRVNRSFAQLKSGAAALAGALAVRQFVGFTRAALDANDAIAKQSRQIGLSAAEFQRYRIEGELAGVATEKLSSGVGAFTKRVGELRAGTGTLVTILDKANVGLKNQLLAAESTAAGMRVMLTAIREADTAFEKNALSAAAFGRQAGQAMVLLAESAGTLNEEMVTTVTRSDAILAASERLKDETTLLQSAFSAGFDSGIVRDLSGAVDASADSMREARQIGEELGQAVGASMRGVAAAAKFVIRNLREIATIIAAIAAAKAAQMFFAMAVAVAKFAQALVAARTAGAAFSSFFGKKGRGIAMVGGVVAAGAAFVALDREINDVLETASAYAATLDGEATPATAGLGKATQDVVEALQQEKEELTLLKRAHLGLESSVENVNIAIETSNQLRAAGVTLADEEGQRIARLVLANAELKKSIDGITEAQKAQKEVDEELKRERQRRAEEQARIMQQPFLNALDGIQDAFTSTFEKIFSGGVNSFSDLADSVKRIFVRLAAEVATLMVFRPVVGSVLGGVGLGGVAGQLGASASSLGGGIAGGGGFGGGGFGALGSFGGLLGAPTLNSFLTPAQAGVLQTHGTLSGAADSAIAQNLIAARGGFNFGGFLGSAALGFGAGSLVSSLTGGNSTGGTIGSGLGSIGGALLGGPIGALVGGGLGGLLGGLFGGDGRSVGPNANAEIDIVNGRFVPGIARADNGGSRSGARAFATQVSGAVNAILDELDARLQSSYFLVGDFGGQFRVGTQYNRGRLDRALGSDSGAAAQQATLFAFEQLGLQGVDPALAAAVQRAAQISEDLQDFATNIDFARTLLDEGLFDSEELSQAEQALKGLNAQFAEAADRAARLGLSVTKVEQLRDRALADLTAGFEEGVSRQILAITDPLQAALDAQAAAAEQRVREAEALGADLVAVERLNALERARVIEQVNRGLLDFRDQLTFGGLSGADPANTLAGSRAAFDAAVAQGASSQRIIGLGQSYLQASRDFNASSPGFFADLERVRGVVESRLSGGGSTADSLAAAISGASDREALDAARIVDQLRASGQSQARVEDLLEEILRELKQQAAA